MAAMNRARSAEGMSLIEATIVLLMVSIITAVAAPAASRVLDEARIAAAIEGAEAIKTAMHLWSDDLSAYDGFNTDGSLASSDPVEMAVSDGDIPVEVSFDGDDRWTHPVCLEDQTLPFDFETPACDPGNLFVDFLENHMVHNNPFGGNAGDAYDLSGGNTWRGAYLDSPVDPDPWGNRYAVNVKYLQQPADTKNDTVVLSAGPDEQVDTDFEEDGITPGDDDIIVVIQRDRNMRVP